MAKAKKAAPKKSSDDPVVELLRSIDARLKSIEAETRLANKERAAAVDELSRLIQGLPMAIDVFRSED